MAEADQESRLQQAFLRGYRDAVAATDPSAAQSASPVFPYASICESAHLESLELRRSIDACQSAFSQIEELPEHERTQVRQELKSTLGHLLTVSGQLIDDLRALGVESAEPAAPATSTKGRSSDGPKHAPPKKSIRRR